MIEVICAYRFFLVFISFEIYYNALIGDTKNQESVLYSGLLPFRTYLYLYLVVEVRKKKFLENYEHML